MNVSYTESTLTKFCTVLTHFPLVLLKGLLKSHTLLVFFFLKQKACNFEPFHSPLLFQMEEDIYWNHFQFIHFTQFLSTFDFQQQLVS